MKEEPSKTEELKSQVYSRQEYAKANFWDERYSENSGFFDWYAEYPELKHAFQEYNLSTTDRILMVGCGNSKLSHQMWEKGFTQIINIDISPSVIEQMKAEFPNLTWEVMDATKMSYKDGQFDAIIDKGTLDALIAGKNYQICQQMLKQCMRVTKENGQLLLITYGSPEGRQKIFENVLPFDYFDYYQCRAELNDMSTMINLMRSNLKGKGLKEIINDKEAMTKTMREYKIVKMLRLKRKNKKQYILWNKTEKKQIEMNPTYLQGEHEPKPQNATEKHSEEKAEQKTEIKIEQNAPKKETAKQSTFVYEPKKQSFVYVYSIRRKFAIDIKETLKDLTDNELEQKYSIKETTQFISQHPQEDYPFTIYTEQTNYLPIIKAAEFLKRKNIQVPSFQLATSYKNSLQNSLRFNLLACQDIEPSVLALRKTNLLLKISVGQRTTLEGVLSELSKLSRQLVTQCDLYPCPKTYALFHVLKSRCQPQSVNSLLQKYWFPTYRVQSFSSNELVVKISLPPLIKQKQEAVICAIGKHLKFVKIEIMDRAQGFLSYFDLQLFNVVSKACLSYNNSKTELVLEEFWEKDGLCDKISQSMLTESHLYYKLYCTVIIPRKVLSKVMTHVLAFY